MPGQIGNKGGGRKSARDEHLISQVVNKSWARVNQNLDGQRLTEQQKDIVALEVVKRTAPKNIDLTTKGRMLPTPIYGSNSTIPIQGHPSNTEGIPTPEKN